MQRDFDEVFAEHAGQLNSVVPICVHGDEGRSQKKSKYLLSADPKR